ncbi:MAG: DNA polymerase domain-containing protein [Verrucomicrobiota bacterium]|nr:DNA polymerase domain-containing protein [Verrucomicrobiota bacterium]
MESGTRSLCGLSIDKDGHAHCLWALPDGSRMETVDTFEPFCWTSQPAQGEELSCTELAGPNPLRYLLRATSVKATFPQNRELQREIIKPFEHQFLLAKHLRFFAGMNYGEVRRCQLDIETACESPGGFSNAAQPGDRILAIGLWLTGQPSPILLTTEDKTDTAEKALLVRFGETLQALDPDIIEGHNIFNFDLDYLRQRCKRFKLPCNWGRFGEAAIFRKSRLRVAERWIDFLRCDLPGRAVFDTYFAIQIYDVGARELDSYGLKSIAVQLGVTDERAETRTYISGSGIQKAFDANRAQFLAYLTDDLRETRGVADLLLPTYFAQAQNFPMLPQEIFLRGTATKVDIVLLEQYYAKRYSLPEPATVGGFEGGFTKSYATGTFKNVLHFDVASLYPSLLLRIGRNPCNDTLGVFIPLLQELRTERLKYKSLARTAATEDMRTEYTARQQSFKVLINSFYGYLGFGGARFADGDLAAEVTRRGRELLQALIAEFERLGCAILEADTDGIYLASPTHWETPEVLLAAVTKILPAGIELEYDGRYDTMFCYKSKNYALWDGNKVTMRGSALRSRGIEPFLQELTQHFIHFALGIKPDSPAALVESLRNDLQSGKMPIHRIKRSEYLSQNPASYLKEIEGGDKSRRASLEVALTMQPPPRMGDKVSYYITRKEKGKSSDWQRARAVKEYDPVKAPYDPEYYLKKIDDWLERYGEFYQPAPVNRQQELF